MVFEEKLQTALKAKSGRKVNKVDYVDSEQSLNGSHN